jgi:membrane-bound acyltransferase YfiQ involved in biofilm formation
MQLAKVPITQFPSSSYHSYLLGPNIIIQYFKYCKNLKNIDIYIMS